MTTIEAVPASGTDYVWHAALVISAGLTSHLLPRSWEVRRGTGRPSLCGNARHRDWQPVAHWADPERFTRCSACERLVAPPVELANTAAERTAHRANFLRSITHYCGSRDPRHGQRIGTDYVPRAHLERADLYAATAGTAADYWPVPLTYATPR